MSTPLRALLVMFILSTLTTLAYSAYLVISYEPAGSFIEPHYFPPEIKFANSDIQFLKIEYPLNTDNQERFIHETRTSFQDPQCCRLGVP